jgi:membrane-associated protease RseP (regulator of RpoE activity)
MAGPADVPPRSSRLARAIAVAALGIGAFIVALILVIVIHEAAHFAVARAFGIKVTEFFVGFGPKLWSRMRGETEVGVKAIVAGGYVKIAGMNPYETIAPEDYPRTFGAKPIWQRSLVILAGPATHFVLAFLCFALWLGFVGQPVAKGTMIDRVVPRLEGTESPAAAAGLQPGDVIVAVDNIRDPSTEQLVRYQTANAGEPITFTIRRDGTTLQLELVPVPSEGVEGEQIGRIGVNVGPRSLVRDTAGVLGSVTGAADLVGDNLAGTVRGVARIFGPEGVGRLATLVFTDEPRRDEDPASVVGIGRVAGSLASDDRFGDLLLLFGVVNVFVGLLNLLPLPPFDGGHLAMLAIEKIRGRPVDMRKVIPVSAAVAAFFIIFTVAVVYVDLVKPPV